MSRFLLPTILCSIAGAAPGGEPSVHWAFQKLSHTAPPEIRGRAPIPSPIQSPIQSPIDQFIAAKLASRGLALSPRADRATLLARLSFDLTGLPPTPAAAAAFAADDRPDAYSQAVERLLASPHYGERWGKVWLDAAGYADSNGYFNADTDRPLAYKYRDYVIRACNSDKPFDQFVREQLAGDEIAGYFEGAPVTPETIELLTATHFLRNGQDGSSESDGNPDEVTIDRATVLEGALQISMNTLLGITIQCARCHEHKFEPIEHAEYYRLQAVFYPAFPALHRDQWVGPVQRVSHVADKSQLEAWERRERRLDDQRAALRREFSDWRKAHRPAGAVVFADDFDGPAAVVAANWSTAAPGDDASGGAAPVKVDSSDAPGARIHGGALRLLESGGAGNRWLSTRQSIDWTPAGLGEWVQVTFDLVDDKVDQGGASAARIGYYIALHDYDDNSPRAGGNLLIDGNPAGGAALHLDYPGDDQRSLGAIGASGYRPGRNYGVRITNLGERKFRIEQLVDGLPEKPAVTLAEDDLPDGGFGFEFCCGRSFIVDNVVIESVAAGDSQRRDEAVAGYLQEHQARWAALEQALAAIDAQRVEKPGKLAWVTDLVSPAPTVHRLERGLYAEPAEPVAPAGLAALTDGAAAFQLPSLPAGVASSGRRLAFANWITRPDSRPAALLARVMVNRIWQEHFGRGLVATPDNFGHSGAAPSHPELLEHLAEQFIRSGWSVKAMHRLILNTGVYQQAGADREDALQADPDNLLLSRYPLRRLSAESIRDAMLAVSGEIDERHFGPYVPAKALDDGNIVVDESHPAARRRGIYLQQRRTQMNSLLTLFDAPAMVSTCSQRSVSTAPLQSLALLNSSFVRRRAAALARRVAAVSEEAETRVEFALRLVFRRAPTRAEQRAAEAFLQSQRVVYERADKPPTDCGLQALADLCQMLFASNAFLYLE